MAQEKAAEMYVNEEVDGGGRLLYLDKVASVSGARRDELTMIFDDEVLNEQHERHVHSSRELPEGNESEPELDAVASLDDWCGPQ